MTSTAVDQQKVAIATYFVMNAPYGEANEVIKDVSKLVNDTTSLSEENLTKIVRTYNLDQMVVANDPSGNAVMVNAHAEVDANHYLDPKTNKVLAFNHRTLQFSDPQENKKTMDEKVSKYRVAIEKAMQTYYAGNYKAEKGLVAVYGKDDGKIVICISARNVNLANYWTGNWRSVFTLDLSKSSSELKGTIKVAVHYCEDGNVQLHSNIDKTATITIGNESATATDVAKAVAKIEGDFQDNLGEMYVRMHQSTFKTLRRVLPVTQQTMTWSTSVQRLASDITKS
eukprot:TRINITY_DN10344_c0_g1_i1.p1 TRINITY_DN10344_c0_g1~~TRINITY_DN10344_c0_g1_i1.p1  ORF type:complete len:284 (-),score=66.75 TRINITY_DN10344_c0_g1_i1:352-1203(-)